MEAPLISRFFVDEHVKAICWMLIHSLWIGLICAAIAGASLMITQKASSRLRYLLLCGCLIMFTILTGYFLVRGWSATGPVPESSSGQRIFVQDFLGKTNGFAPNGHIVGILVTFINRNATWIFAVWLLFFILKSAGMIAGLLYINRIRSRKAHPVAQEWRERMNEMCKVLGIRDTVRLLQSELVKVPVTVGHLKPVILLPIGLLFQLPAGQIETILLHELAHIQRRDYLVNLLQSLLETIFFFNPAFLWISALVRAEREACCDDIVLAHTRSKTNYLEALLAFQTIQNTGSQLVLGMGGNQLVHRLKRIINHENKRLNKMEKIVLLAGLLIVSAFSYLPNPKERDKGILVKIVEKPAVKSQSVIDDKLEPELIKVKSGKQIKPVNISAPTENLSAENPSVANDTTLKINSIQFFQSNEDMGNREMEVRDDKGNVYQIKIADQKLTSLKINGKEVPENELTKHENLIVQIDETWAAARDRKRDLMFRKKEAAFVYKQETSYHKEKFEYRKSANYEPKMGKKAFLRAKSDKTFKPTGEDLRWQKGDYAFGKDKKTYALAKRYPSERFSYVTGVKKMPREKDISADQERVRGIIAELVKEGVITNSSDVEWFGLSNAELVVNGKKQSRELQQRLKETYKISEGNGLYYGPVKINGQGVFLDKEDLD